jgi:hypothetical protein
MISMIEHEIGNGAPIMHAFPLDEYFLAYVICKN